MKILFVIDTLDIGGAERSLLQILPELKKYQPVLCYVYPGNKLQSEFEKRGIKILSLNVSGHYNFIVAARKLRDVVEREKPVLIHSTLFRSDVVARIAARKSKIPLVSSLVNNSYHPFRFKNGFVFRIKLRVIQLVDLITAGQVDKFISNSASIKDATVKDLAVPASKIVVIYRGRNIEALQTDSKRVMNLKKDLRCDMHRVILNVSRLLDRKGQLDLIKALPKVLLQFPDVKLLIAGEGPYRETLEREIRSLNLENNVSLLGTRNDIADLFQAADVFVFPSYYEGLPGTLIEAMLAGIPIISSNIPENLECVDDASATLFPVGNVDALANAIIDFFARPDNFKLKVDNAKQEARRKFDLQKIVRQYERVYDELIDSI